MAQVTNVVIQQQPMGRRNDLLIGSVHGHRDWTSGLFGCCQDCLGVLKACYCMECLICSLNSRIGECPCAHWLVPGALINIRTRVRTLGGINGSMIGDCFAMSCCFPMAVCQVDRELKAMGL